MSGGIDQLVDTYKGNPQPLAANVQQAQKQQPPGEIPADLEEAMALQKIAELRNAFAGQQAMQAGGAQPSIMQKLKQIVGGMQAQAQPPVMPGAMPARPVMAARGGSIDQLMSNLGTNYARGGIIAFTPGGDVEDEKLSEADAKDIERRMRERTMPPEKKEAPSEYIKQMSNLLGFFGNLGGDAIKTLVSAPGYGFSADSKPATRPTTAPVTATDPADIRAQLNAADAARYAERPTPVAPTPPTPKPNVGIGGGPAQPPKEAVDPNSLRAITEAYLRNELGVNPDTERDKAVDWTKKTLGLDALLAEKQGRADSRKEAIAGIQAARTPEWIKGLQGLSKGPIRGGAGMVLGQLGANTVAAREDYEAQDLKYRDELDRLRDVITDAKIKGNQELVKEGMAAYKEVDARRRAAAQSTTSLLNTDANIEASNQRAREAAASRAQVAAIQSEDRKARRLQDQNQFLAKLQTQHEALLNKDPEWQRMSKMKGMLDFQMMATQDEAKRDKIADQLSEQQAKMTAYATSKIGGGTVNIPPPPKDAVKRIG